MTTGSNPRRALVLGAGGFIGSHLARRLKQEGLFVRGVDLERPRYRASAADEFELGDLCDAAVMRRALAGGFDEIYQLAADMGGAGYIFTGANDAAIMHNSAQINLNLLDALAREPGGRVFYSSSACIYPEHNQLDPAAPVTRESSAYPAAPDSEYGWEKLFSERLFQAYARNCGLTVRIARYHNVFGPEGAWNNGREKVPAALCRKIAETPDGGTIEIWGDGEQTRSFLYIDECLEGTLRLMRSDFAGPVNIGSAEMISINQFAALIMRIAGKSLSLRHVPGPLGVRGRCSDNHLIAERLGWAPSLPLTHGITATYRWIEAEVRAGKRDAAA
jgi:nucleoside-diphosphate-sugar epimerase